MNNVCYVLMTVGFSAGDWVELVTRLDPESRHIDTGAIASAFRNVSYLCLLEAIRIWLQTHEDHSWIKLAEVVKKVPGYGAVTADSILAQSGNVPM